MAENGDGPRLEPAPPMPQTLVLSNSVNHFERRPDGGMELIFTPIIVAGGGRPMPIGTQVRIFFNPVSWERFKREVEADGVKAPRIQTATGLPPL